MSPWWASASESARPGFPRAGPDGDGTRRATAEERSFTARGRPPEVSIAPASRARRAPAHEGLCRTARRAGRETPSRLTELTHSSSRAESGARGQRGRGTVLFAAQAVRLAYSLWRWLEPSSALNKFPRKTITRCKAAPAKTMPTNGTKRKAPTSTSTPNKGTFAANQGIH